MSFIVNETRPEENKCMYYHRTSLDACVFLPRLSGRRPAEKKSISDISQHIVKEACIWENVLYFKREPVFNNNNPTGSMSKPGGIVCKCSLC